MIGLEIVRPWLTWLSWLCGAALMLLALVLFATNDGSINWKIRLVAGLGALVGAFFLIQMGVSQIYLERSR